MDEVELGKKCNESRCHERPGPGLWPQQATAAVNGEQRAQAEQGREDSQQVGGQGNPAPGPGFGRDVDHAIDIDKRRGIPDPGERVLPHGLAPTGRIEGRDDDRADQVIEWRLGGFLPQEFVNRVLHARQPAAIGDVRGGEEVPVLIGRFE